MANYLIPADGNTATAVGTARQRGDVISVDDMYRVKIYNKSGSIKFTGFVPPDFTFSLSSGWSAPFGDTSIGQGIADRSSGTLGKLASTADTALKLGGASSIHKLASFKMWGGPSYFTLDLPIFVDAYDDTRSEVVETTYNLLSLCAPSEVGGILVAPGPSPAKAIANAAAATAGQNVEFSDDEAFTVDIGNFFSMTPCVVDSVSANFDNVWEDGTGNPISVDFVLQVSSYFAVTREDLKKWLKLSQT